MFKRGWFMRKLIGLAVATVAIAGAVPPEIALFNPASG